MGHLFKVLLISLAFAVIVMGADDESESRGFSSGVSSGQIEAALKNDRYLKRQLQCALGTQPCDAVGKKLKELAPQVLRNNCVKCTPDELNQIRKVLITIQNRFPKEFGMILRQYRI
ncbi:hypothetical protein HCN44_008524 [Aphidius gifuensis]